jgi:1,4-dihydroxy-2-naphthoate octaprenyltransferase
VVRIGRRAAVALYAACIAGAALTPAVLYAWTGQHPWAMSAALVVGPAVPVVRTLASTTDPEALNPLLGATGRLLLLYSLLFAGGWVAGALV